jgi:hypothetical protein
VLRPGSITSSCPRRPASEAPLEPNIRRYALERPPRERSDDFTGQAGYVTSTGRAQDFHEADAARCAETQLAYEGLARRGPTSRTTKKRGRTAYP